MQITHLKRLLIISGLSGGGKSVALGALEDFGFHCIDNLPLSLLNDFVTLILSNDFTPSNVAIGIDARAVDKSISQLHKSISEIEQNKIKIELVFLSASQDCLLKRFSETRRKHPLSSDQLTLKDAIAKEAEILSEVNSEADIVIDTTLYNIHDLRRTIKNVIAKSTGRTLALQFISFGFKRGIPLDADFVFDMRCLPNPYWELSLRDKTGTNFLREAGIFDYMKGALTINFEAVPDYLSTLSLISLDSSNASSAVSITPNFGYGILLSLNSVENCPLSSAKSRA